MRKKALIKALSVLTVLSLLIVATPVSAAIKSPIGRQEVAVTAGDPIALNAVYTTEGGKNGISYRWYKGNGSQRELLEQVTVTSGANKDVPIVYGKITEAALSDAGTYTLDVGNGTNVNQAQFSTVAAYIVTVKEPGPVLTSVEELAVSGANHLAGRTAVDAGSDGAGHFYADYEIEGIDGAIHTSPLFTVDNAPDPNNVGVGIEFFGYKLYKTVGGEGRDGWESWIDVRYEGGKYKIYGPQIYFTSLPDRAQWNVYYDGAEIGSYKVSVNVPKPTPTISPRPTRTPIPSLRPSRTPTRMPPGPLTPIPTPTRTPPGPLTPTPTRTPPGPLTPTPTRTPPGPLTPTPTRTPPGPLTPTPTRTPPGPLTPTPTRTPPGPLTVI